MVGVTLGVEEVQRKAKKGEWEKGRRVDGSVMAEKEVKMEITEGREGARGGKNGGGRSRDGGIRGSIEEGGGEGRGYKHQGRGGGRSIGQGLSVTGR